MEQQQPLISVIMPVYNAENFLREAVESILAQTYRNFELLIFNDGSTDNSLAMLRQFASKDDRITLIDSKVNKGYLVHLNEGLAMAKGKYIARMDSDDVSMPQRFEKQLQLLEEGRADIVGSNVIFFKGDVRQKGKLSRQAASENEARIQMVFSSPVYHPTVMFSRRLVDEKNYHYDENYYPAEDYELWSRLLLRYRFINIQEPLVYYRESDTQISNTRKHVQRDLAFSARCRYVGQIVGSPLDDMERTVLKDFFYDSRRPFTPVEMDSLFSLFDKILNRLDVEDRAIFCRYLLDNLSYLTNRKNKFYREYFRRGLDRYFKGTLSHQFNAAVRQVLK